MRIDVLTLFPEMFEVVLQSSILGRALQAGLVTINLHNIRDYAADKHHVTDDYPYGGGGGMVMKPEPIFAAVEAVLGTSPEEEEVPVILLTPQGRLFNEQIALEYAHQKRLLLLCGRYEGVDERVRQSLVTEELSIGDYVISGGELAAMVVVDAVVRLLPGALGDPTGALDDSHVEGLLEYPHYTRPQSFRGMSVPEVLLSGHHAEIERWRRQESLRRTLQRRPALLRKVLLSQEDMAFLRSLGYDPADRGSDLL